MKKKLNKQFGIRLGGNQIKKLEEIANAKQLSVAAVIRRFIDYGIKKEANTNTAEKIIKF